MSAVGGMFNIIQAGQLGSLIGGMRAKSAPAASGNALTSSTSSIDTATAGSTDPSTWKLKRGETAIEAFWRLAPDVAKEHAPTIDLMKRLEKMKESGNSDILAEKLRQAKVKLSALRQQLQLAAAHGDPRQIKRIAAEAARLAREIGSAARDLSQGVAAGTATYTSDAQAAQSATNAASASAVAPAANLAQGADRDAAFKALHQIGSDARNAITQAKGLIALAAQMARARRRGNDDDDDNAFFRSLQEQVDAALDNVDTGQREAIDHLLVGSEAGTGAEAGAGAEIEVTTTSVEISVTTMVIATQESALGVQYA